MKRRIDIDQLQVGMYVDDLNCSWVDHPFLWNHFLVRNQGQLDAIRATGVTQLTIDTRKGRDAPRAPSVREAEARTQQVLLEVAAQPQAQAVRRKSLEDELGRARRLHEEANAVVQDIFLGAPDNAPVNVANVEALARQLSTSLQANAGALTSLARLKSVDLYTFQHSVSVGVLLMGFAQSLVGFAQSLEMPEDDVILCGVGGLLHDIGKMFVPNEILNKPGKLTPEEFDEIKRHPGSGYDFLLGTDGILDAHLSVVRDHHERLDGSGYPRRLDAGKIGRFARMAAIVDVYDALTSDRCYHRGQPPTAVLRRLVDWSTTHLDADLVQAFVRFVGVYPTGSWVQLDSGRIALVTEQSADSLLAPKVLVVYDGPKRRHLAPTSVSIDAADDAAERIRGVVDPAQFGLAVENYL